MKEILLYDYDEREKEILITIAHGSLLFSLMVRWDEQPGIIRKTRHNAEENRPASAADNPMPRTFPFRPVKSTEFSSYHDPGYGEVWLAWLA